MEEAAKARRQFDEKYAAEKKREGDMEAEVDCIWPKLMDPLTMSSQYSRLGGELSSLKVQLGDFEKDLSEFKNINKRYTDQLIKVKASTVLERAYQNMLTASQMSDMANNDLEKYAKALDRYVTRHYN